MKLRLPGGPAGAAFICALLVPGYGVAQNVNTAADSSTESVIISGTRATDLQVQSAAPNPVESVTSSGLTVLGGPGQSNSFLPLSQLPSVEADSADPYGLSFNRALNVRGKSDFFLLRSIEGMQVPGIVGGADLFDLENVQRQDLYPGALQANQGLGVSNASGVVDQILRGPASQFGIAADGTAGSDDFHRAFARIDTGTFAGNASAFVSGSIAEADKWKGSGTEERGNFTFGYAQSFGPLDVRIFGVYNHQASNLYDSLTYAQVQNLSANYNFDYNRTLTGTPSTDKNYYGFNRYGFSDGAVLGEATLHLTPDQSITFKPYYWQNDGTQLSTSGSGVRDWFIDNVNYGGIAEYDARFGNIGITAGYWYQSLSPEPPPVKQKQYNVTTTGQLSFSNWAVLGTFSNHVFNSPFVQVSDSLGATTLTAGVRYLDQTAPAMQYYVTTGLPDTTYAEVFNSHPLPDSSTTVAARDFYKLLPNAGVTQEITPDLSINAAYSQKIARVDYGPQASSYLGAESAFKAQSVTLAQLMDGLQPELDHEIDVVPRFDNGVLTVGPDFFFYKALHKEVLVFNPAVGQSYYQSNGGTTGYGIDLPVSYRVMESLFLFGSASWGQETYDANIPISKTATMDIKGKQVPDDPRYTLKGGLTFSSSGFSISPVARYVSTRYGLADDSQSVRPYWVADIYASYNFRQFGLDWLTFSVWVQNLFDQRYIGVISVNEDNLSSTAYYAGAPRTIAGGFSVRY